VASLIILAFLNDDMNLQDTKKPAITLASGLARTLPD
jgi:hypothetical protein